MWNFPKFGSRVFPVSKCPIRIFISAESLKFQSDEFWEKAQWYSQLYCCIFSEGEAMWLRCWTIVLSASTEPELSKWPWPSNEELHWKNTLRVIEISEYFTLLHSNLYFIIWDNLCKYTKITTKRYPTVPYLGFNNIQWTPINLN